MRILTLLFLLVAACGGDTARNSGQSSVFVWGKSEDAKKLDEERRSIFHTFVMKAMFLCKRARPDIDLAISNLPSQRWTPLQP